MRTSLKFAVCSSLLFLAAWIRPSDAPSSPESILIQHGVLVDGTGSPRRQADVRLTGDIITAVGKLEPLPGEHVIDAAGLIVAPGFIDTLSHADSGIMEDPLAETQIRQGITTAIVGHDGASNYPLKDWFGQIERKHTALNFASFTGHGTVRHMVMGDKFKRNASAAELEKMVGLVEEDMRSGALGLSTGLEYDPGYYSNTDELIACAREAQQFGGIYVSHVRDEGDKAFESFRELIHIAEAARIPAQISHIKLDTSPAWYRAPEAIRLMADARKRGLDITADVYPYTYWQSSITVLSPSRDLDNRQAWEKGLAEVGGPTHVLLGCYTPDTTWAGKTVSQIAADTGQDPVSVIEQIVHKTRGAEFKDTEAENVVVDAMTERDVKSFVCDPHIMFCSDGSMDDTHPRGAGTFPRVLGYYVRELHALTLEQAIHKMTGLPAQRMKLAGRGLIEPGMKADITLFDPATVRDTATTAAPHLAPIGIPYVIVNGQLVLENGKVTGRRPGMALRHAPPVSAI